MGDEVLRLWWCPEQASSLSRRARTDQLLRIVLSATLGLSAEELVFAREAKGRPFLRNDHAPDFNLTDTGGGTLIALCRRGRIGVDIERLDRDPPVAKLAARWFDPAEATALAQMAPDHARTAFLRLWTAKEASCKATGTGIFGHLNGWQFDPLADQPQLRQLPDSAGERARWSFLRLAPSNRHTAVVSVRDAGFERVETYSLLE